jgi:coproporphyrinogen III oxidase
METQEQQESVAMPATKDDLKHFLRVLASKPRGEWGMDQKQYRRYRNGEFPAEFAWLLDRPELIVALLVDATLYAERTAPTSEATDE